MALVGHVFREKLISTFYSCSKTKITIGYFNFEGSALSEGGGNYITIGY